MDDIIKEKERCDNNAINSFNEKVEQLKIKYPKYEDEIYSDHYMYNEELKHIEVWKRHSLRMNSVKYCKSKHSL
jgi:hypothetical protein